MADLYESALRVYRDDGNPARLILAAHSIREMTGALPKVLDLPILAKVRRRRVTNFKPTNQITRKIPNKGTGVVIEAARRAGIIG